MKYDVHLTTQQEKRRMVCLDGSLNNSMFQRNAQIFQIFYAFLAYLAFIFFRLLRDLPVHLNSDGRGAEARQVKLMMYDSQ